MDTPATTRLLWAVHNHQPVGNFDFVFENAYRNAYLPFVEVLERHPSIGVDFHFSGPLFDWLDRQHPDYLERIANLVKKQASGNPGWCLLRTHSSSSASRGPSRPDSSANRPP